MNTTLPAGTLNTLWSDPKNWRAYGFYFCKADPRFIVPKRNRWGGWTTNFAHRSGWIALIVLTADILIPTLCLIETRSVHTWVGFVTIVALLISVSAICCFFASPNRYETKG